MNLGIVRDIGRSAVEVYMFLKAWALQALFHMLLATMASILGVGLRASACNMLSACARCDRNVFFLKCSVFG